MREAGVRRDRAAAARQSRRDAGEDIARAARRLGVAGHHAGDRRRAAVRSAAARTSARPTRCPRVRLATIAAAGEAARAVHLRHPDRHRRDARRSASRRCWRCATCTRATATSRKSSSRISAPSPARAWRSAPSRRSTIMLWTIAVARIVFGAGDEHPGAAQSQPPARWPRLIARRHQRLGRRLAGDARSRQSGGAVAGSSTRLRAATARGRQGAGRAAGDLSGVRRAMPARWLDPALRAARAARESTPRASRAPTTGRRAAQPMPPPHRCRAAGARRTTGCSADRSIARDGRQRLERERHRRAVRGARRRASHAVCAAADALRAASRRRRASPTSSTATSTTPTSAPTAARSAPSPRARRSEHLRGRPYDLDARRDRARAAAKPGSAAPPKSACRAASIRATPATTYLAICRAVKARAAGPARPRLLAARSLAGRARRSALRVPDFLARAARRRARLAARHRGGNPRRRGARRDLSRQGHDRSNGST